MTILKQWDIDMNKVTKIIFFIVILLQGCSGISSGINTTKVIYFLFMSDLDNNGKMTFRTRLEKKELEEYKNKSQEKVYYRVFHEGLPLKVEEVNFKTNKTNKTYFFDKHGTMNKTIRYYDKKSIVCAYTYKKYRSIKECNNGVKTIRYFNENGGLVIEEEYKENMLQKKKMNKNNYSYFYDKNNILIKKYPYEDAGYVLPIENPLLDNYPFRSEVNVIVPRDKVDR